MQRRRPVGTATSAVPSSGTSVQPSPRAARAGYSAVRSGDDVKIALSTSSGAKPLACWSAARSSSVASRIASLVLAAAVVAPRRPRRILVMALADQLRLMVITDPVLLKGRDPVAVCRAAVAGGATMIQVRWKDGTPAEILELTGALVAALPVPVLVNDRVDIALAAGAAGAHLGWDDPPLDSLRPHLPAGFLLGVSIGTPDEAARAPATADYWSVGPCFATPTKPDAGAPLGPEGFTALARLAPEGGLVVGIGGITPANSRSIGEAGACGVAVVGDVLGGGNPETVGPGIPGSSHSLLAPLSRPLPRFNPPGLSDLPFSSPPF